MPKRPWIRDWSEARAKVDEEGVCRGCGKPTSQVRLESAHTLGRDYDLPVGCVKCGGSGEGSRVGTKCGGCNGRGLVLWVDPDLTIPLCGPSTSTGTCHGRDHAGTLDKLPLLTGREQVAAVKAIVTRAEALGQRNVGIAEAYRRLTTRDTPEPAAPSDPAATVEPIRGQTTVYDIIEGNHH